VAMVQQAADGGATISSRLLAVSYIRYGLPLYGLFTPSPRVATFGLTKLGSGYYTHGLLYLNGLPSSEATPMFGFVLSVLAVCGLALSWRRRNAWLLGLLWLAAALLALGPSLWINSADRFVPLAEMWHGVRVSAIMPYTWFVRVPGLSSFREAGRLAVLGLLAAALLAGSAVDWLRYHARPVMVGVLALSVLELGWSGNPPGNVMPPTLRIQTMPTSMPMLDGPIAADHSKSIVVDFPFGIRGGVPEYGGPFAPQSQVLATLDGHPRAIGFISRVPAKTTEGISSHPFYAGLVDIWHQIPRPLALVHKATMDARHMNVRWVVVWPTRLPRSIQGYLTHTGFRLAYQVGSGITVYRRVDR
jgi:hypothetical protein